MKVTPEMLTDEDIVAAECEGVISPSLSSAATRRWHTGTGLARLAARIEIANEINAANERDEYAHDERWLASEKRQIEADQFSLDMRIRAFERKKSELELKKSGGK